LLLVIGGKLRDGCDGDRRGQVSLAYVHDTEKGTIMSRTIRRVLFALAGVISSAGFVAVAAGPAAAGTINHSEPFTTA
jgi:hypothetical protein